MKRLISIAFILAFITNKTAAQQNWAAVPCFRLDDVDNIGRMMNDDAHNELILVPSFSYKICNTTYKGLFAYNGNTFHDLDRGIETHDPNLYTGSVLLVDCAEFNGKAIIIGGFSSVGRDTLWSRNIGTWNGTKWDTFPQPFWSNSPTATVNAGFSKLLSDNGKLWMFGSYDSSGVFKQRPVLYDGSTFTPVPRIPVNNPSAITEAIKYKNKLVVSGSFYDYPSFNFYRLAQFDGTSWSQMGGGVRGGLSACQTVAVYNDTLYIGGAFPAPANAGNYLMKWDGTQLTDAGFSSVFCGYGAIWKLLPYKNRLYAFGGFHCAAGKNAFGVAYYENGKWTVPQDSIEGNGIFDAAVYNDAIYIAGSFKSINGDTGIHKFARLMCPDFDAAAGCISGVQENPQNLDVNIFPNPTNGKLRVEQTAGINRLSIANALGQQMFYLNNPAQTQDVDISNLPAGIYFIKVENRQGQGVFKVVKN